MTRRKQTFTKKLILRARKAALVVALGASASAGAQYYASANPSAVIPTAVALAATGNVKGAYKTLKAPAQRLLRAYATEVVKHPVVLAVRAAIP